MAETKQYSCDICGTIKKDSNHWWKAILEPGDGLKFYRWTYKVSEIVPVIHICGAGCAIKKLSEFMGADPVASTNPMAGLAALPIHPLVEKSGSQTKKENYDETHFQPQWTRNGPMGDQE